MAKVLRGFSVHKICKRKSMFALFYFGSYIDKITIEIKNSSKNKPKKPLQFTEKEKHTTSSFTVGFGISSGVAVCQHE